MKNLFYYFLLVLSFSACTDEKDDQESTTDTASTFIPKDFSLLVSTTPNDYIPLLFQLHNTPRENTSSVPDLSSLLQFAKLNEKVYGFQKGQHISGISFDLRDSTAFRLFISENSDSEFSTLPSLQVAQTTIQGLNLYAIWSHSKAIIFQSTHQLKPQQLNDLVDTNKCIPIEELFNYNSDQLVNYYINVPDSLFETQNLQLQGSINIIDSTIAITSELQENLNKINIFAPAKKCNLPEGLVSGHLNLTDQAKQRLLERISIDHPLAKYLTTWSGEISWVYSGTDTLKSTIVSYDYDENFNEIEVKKINKKPFYKINGNLVMQSTSEAHSLLQALDQMGILVKQKQDYTSILFTDMTKISSSEENILIRSAEEPQNTIEKTSSFFIKLDNRANNLIEHLKLPNIHLQRFRPLTQDIDFLTIDSPSTNSIKLKLKFNQPVIPALQSLVLKSKRI